MKTYANITTHIPIDTASLGQSINRLCLHVVALLDSGMHRAAFAAARKAQRMVRAFCKSEFANQQAKVKLDMLCHKHWRRLVLKELGGAKALVRWFAAMERYKLRAANTEEDEPIEPSIWRKTPERMEEELRQKAHAQKCRKAYAAGRSNILRDPFKMDSDGQFRLPPLPRLSRPRDPEAAWTTPFDIMEYHYDATPVAKVRGYAAPIMVWPAEFEAAELWDYERWLRGRQVTSSTLSSRTRFVGWLAKKRAQNGGSSVKGPCLPNDPPSHEFATQFQRCGMTELENRQAQEEDHGLRPVNIGVSDEAA